MSRNLPGQPAVCLVSRATAPGHREVTVDVGDRRRLLELCNESFDLVPRVQFTQEALPSLPSFPRGLAGGPATFGLKRVRKT